MENEAELHEDRYAAAQVGLDLAEAAAAQLICENRGTWLVTSLDDSDGGSQHPWVSVLRVLMLTAELKGSILETPKGLSTFDGITDVLLSRGTSVKVRGADNVLAHLVFESSFETCTTKQLASAAPLLSAASAALARAVHTLQLESAFVLESGAPEELDPEYLLTLDTNMLRRLFRTDGVANWVQTGHKRCLRVQSVAWAAAAAQHLTNGGADLCSAVVAVCEARDELEAATVARSAAIAAALAGSTFLARFQAFPGITAALAPHLPGFTARSVPHEEALATSKQLQCAHLEAADFLFTTVPAGGYLGWTVFVRGSDARVCAVVEDGQAMLEGIVQSYVEHSYNRLLACTIGKAALLPTHLHLLEWDHLVLFLHALPRYRLCGGVPQDTLGAYGKRYCEHPNMHEFEGAETALGGRLPVFGTRIGYVRARVEKCATSECPCACHGVGSAAGCDSCLPVGVTSVEFHTEPARNGRGLGIHVRAGDCTFKIAGDDGAPKMEQAKYCSACAVLAKRCNTANARAAAAEKVDALDERPLPPARKNYAELLRIAVAGTTAQMSAAINELVDHAQKVEAKMEEYVALAADLKVELEQSVSLRSPDSARLRKLLLSDEFMKSLWSLTPEELGMDGSQARNKKRLLIMMIHVAAGKTISGNRGNSWHPELVSLFQHIKALSLPAFNCLADFLPMPGVTTINRATSAVSSKGGADPQKVQQARASLSLAGLKPDGMIVQISMDVMQVKKGIVVDASGFVVGTCADVGKFVLFPSAPPPKAAAAPAAPSAAAAAARPAFPAGEVAEGKEEEEMEEEEEEEEEEGGEGGSGALDGAKRARPPALVEGLVEGGQPAPAKKAKAPSTKKSTAGGVVDTLAGKILIVMARALGHARLTFEIATYPIRSEDHMVILEAERECRRMLVGAGFRVKALCFDAGSGNRKAASILTRVHCDKNDAFAQDQLRAGVTPSYYVCPIQKERVYIIYDADHILKRIVMAVFNSGGRTSKLGAAKATFRAMLYDPWGCPVSFEHILLTQRIDVLEHKTLSATFMSARAVLKRGADKMRVDHAMMVCCPATCAFALDVGRSKWDAFINEQMGGRPELEECPAEWRRLRARCRDADAAGGGGGGGGDGGGGGGGGGGRTGGAGSANSLAYSQDPAGVRVMEALRRNPHRATVRTLECGAAVFRSLYNGSWLTKADAGGARLKRGEQAAQFLFDWASEGPRRKGFLDTAVGADALSSIRALRLLLDDVGVDVGGAQPAAVVPPLMSSDLSEAALAAPRKIRMWGRAASTTDLEHHIGALRGSRGYHTITGNNPTVADANRMGAVLFSEDLAKATRRTDYQASVAGRNVTGTSGALLLSMDLALGKEEAEVEEVRRAKALAAADAEEAAASDSTCAFRAYLNGGAVKYVIASNGPGAGNDAKLVPILSMSRIEPMPWSFTGRFFERAGISADPARSMVPPIHPDATAERVKVRSNTDLLKTVFGALAVPCSELLGERKVPGNVEAKMNQGMVSADLFPSAAVFAKDPLITDAGKPAPRFTGNYLGTLFVWAMNDAVDPLLNKKTFLQERGGFADCLHRAIIGHPEVQRLMAAAAKLDPAVPLEEWQLYELCWLVGWWYVLVAMKRFRMRAIETVLEEAKLRDPKQAGNFRAMVNAMVHA